MVTCRVKRDRVHILILVLTCSGCVQPLACFVMVNWWSVTPPADSYGNDGFGPSFYGMIRWADCYAETDDGNRSGGDGGDGSPAERKEWCVTTWGFEPQVGEEAFAVSQLFAIFTAVLCVAGIVTLTLHTFLDDTLSLLTATAFELGAAGMFGLLAVFVFLGFYNTIKSPIHNIGPAFYLLLFGSLLCLPAGGLSAWTAIKGGYYLWGIGKKPQEDDQLLQPMSDARRPSRDSMIDFGDVKVVSRDSGDQKETADFEDIDLDQLAQSKDNLIEDKN